MCSFVQYCATVFSSKQLYTRLSELLGLHDNLLLLNVIVGKMITNLKCYTKCKEVIDHTLNLFLEMTSGYMSGKLLLKLDTVKLMISNKNVSSVIYPPFELLGLHDNLLLLNVIVGKMITNLKCYTKCKEVIDHTLNLFLEMTSGSLYTRLSNSLGLHDNLLLLNVIVGKMITNLKCYTKCKEVIDHTLNLFLEMTSGLVLFCLNLEVFIIQLIYPPFELLGLHDNLLLLNVIVGKMITNLKCYTKCKEVIDHTLNLFLEMTSGYMSGKLLLKLDTVKLMISNKNQLYTRLSELLGLHDNLLLLNVIVGKMITNLKCYTKCKEVIDHTLNLFLEMTSGYMSGKLLLKLDTVKLMISNKNQLYTRLSELLGLHDNLLLLNVIVGKMITNLKCYTKCKEVIDHTLNLFLEMTSGLESTPDALFQSDAVKYAFIGLMRDLRGIAMATNSRRTYGFLFYWLYPAHMPLLLKGITHYADIPES
ncbi:unnamed protein product [Sphenostylis stenocarpa]|uniref:Exportin-7/Ran-binding protein 17 TPR repeats domain-containing protein n=1 Tax=Sphenostylis stenocarpa TaxID=92480 RepID=A0AA86SGI5_9FABA|nr:unnamed protein product [Sphenostylis stenocarpa]